MTDKDVLAEALNYVPRDEIVLACRYWRLLSQASKLRAFEWVVGKAFVTQNGLINLHGGPAELFSPGEVLTFHCPDTGQTIESVATACGVMLAGKGSRSANGFGGFAEKMKLTPNVDRLVFKETKRGTFTITVRRMSAEFVKQVKEVHRKYKRAAAGASGRTNGLHPLLPLQFIQKYVKPKPETGKSRLKPAVKTRS